MDESKKLYPLRFLPERMQHPWGSATYLLADLGAVDSTALGGWLGGNKLSEVMETYLDRVVGDAAFAYFGTQFPVMVKLLEVEGRTPLRLNPDEETAAQRYDAFGKTALWRVLEAGKDSALYLGFRRDVTAEECYRKCLDGTVGDLLHIVHPKKGATYLIPPGMVYAAKGVKLLEIAESSELSFALCDWEGSGIETQLEEAFDLINFRAYMAPDPLEAKEHVRPLAKTPLFCVNELSLKEALRIDSGENAAFQLYSCLGGAALIRSEEGEQWTLAPGETLLVPAEMDRFFLVPTAEDTLLLETMYEN